jgi:hypothetical protein
MADSIFPKILAADSLSDFSVHIKIMEWKSSIKDNHVCENRNKNEELIRIRNKKPILKKIRNNKKPVEEIKRKIQNEEKIRKYLNI